MSIFPLGAWRWLPSWSPFFIFHPTGPAVKLLEHQSTPQNRNEGRTALTRRTASWLAPWPSHERRESQGGPLHGGRPVTVTRGLPGQVGAIWAAHPTANAQSSPPGLQFRGADRYWLCVILPFPGGGLQRDHKCFVSRSREIARWQPQKPTRHPELQGQSGLSH